MPRSLVLLLEVFDVDKISDDRFSLQYTTKMLFGLPMQMCRLACFFVVFFFWYSVYTYAIVYLPTVRLILQFVSVQNNCFEV